MTRYLVDNKEFSHVWYVYTLAYPDGTVFYVGKGTGNRVNSSSDRYTQDNIDKRQAITLVELQGYRVAKRIIATFELEQHAFVYESMLMESYGLKNLTNVHYSTQRRTFMKPHPIQTVDAEISPKGRLIDVLTYERATVQEWEDEIEDTVEVEEVTEDEYEQYEKPEYIHPDDVIMLLNISHSRLLQLGREGVLTRHYTGHNQILYERSEIEALLVERGLMSKGA